MDETVVNGYAPLEDLQHYPTLRSDISTQSLAPGDNKIDVALPSDVKPAALVPIPNFHGKEHHDVLVFDKLESTIGRDEFCDHYIRSIEISRKHAIVKYDKGSWWIVDLHSTNGLLVQGIRLERGESVILESGFSVCFGPAERCNFKYIFHDNYPVEDIKVPCAPSMEMAFIDPSGYESSAPTQDLNSPPLSEQNIPLDQFKSEINKLRMDKAILQTKLKEQADHLRMVSKDYQNTQRILAEKETKYQKKINNLNSMMSKYRTLIGQLESSQPHAHCASSSEDESSNDRPCSELFTGLTMSNLMRELTCSICTEFFVSPTTLSCSHVFCQQCIDSWKHQYRSECNMISNGICPVCRKEVQCQAPVLAFENVINLVLEATLDDQEKEERRKLVEARKQQRLASVSSASTQALPASLGSFLQQIFSGIPRSRRSSIVITSDESDDDGDDEEDDDDSEDEEHGHGVELEIIPSYRNDGNQSDVEVDISLSDEEGDEEYDISITLSGGNQRSGLIGAVLDHGSSGDEIVIEDDDETNSNHSDGVYYYIDDTEDGDDAIVISDSDDQPTRNRRRGRRSSMIILSDSEDSMSSASRDGGDNRSDEPTLVFSNTDSTTAMASGSNSGRRAARSSRRSHPYRRNSRSSGNNNNGPNNADQRATVCV